MALTGLQIQKLLPKTNCRECGSNTCLAFAMKLAAKKADIGLCPYASDEAKQVLGAAYEPPVKPVAFGKDKTLRLGEETVLYRHEKTFVHQTLFAITISDADAVMDIDRKIAAIKNYLLERVGEKITIDMACVTNTNNDEKGFTALVRKVWIETGRPLILRSGNSILLKAAAEAVKGSHSVLVAQSPVLARELVVCARENEHALAITAGDLDALADLSAELSAKGFSDLLLHFPALSPAEKFQVNSLARRAAIRDTFKPLGYPSICFIDPGDELLAATVAAVSEIAKYGGICVLPEFDAAQVSTLMTLRQNIYTDPQKPIQVEPKLYPIGDPRPDSPVFVTTNFSLTYFIVSGEIENSGISAWLVVPECEGMSVLTAWAAGKFSGTTIAAFMKQTAVEQQIKTREITIPGYVAQISGELEENLPGWKVLVGPQEAGDLESFIKARGFK